MTENNRLFHYMGTAVLWIPESELKDYLDPTTVPYKPGEKFLVQHAVWGTWTMGQYYVHKTKPGGYSILWIEWTKVIVVNDK